MRSPARPTRVIGLGLVAIIGGLLAFPLSAATSFDVGVAKIDITPEYPIRLTGYVARKGESTGVEQRLWAKAIAIGSDQQGPVIIVTVDNCGVCANVNDEVAARLKTKAGILREKFAVCSSHTHSAPQTLGFAPNIFAMDLPKEQDDTIARYTRELTDKLERVALAALKDRKPARLEWGKTQVGFAANRRTAGGPTYRALPVLKATSLDGTIRGILANYACHCTTLGATITKTCGDWAGYAQEAVERDNPGAVALIAIGCGADSNPSPLGGPDGGLKNASNHGSELAAAVGELIKGPMKTIDSFPDCSTNRIDVPYAKHFTREELMERAKQNGIVGFHARKYLARLDAGEKLPSSLPYFIQTWKFGDGLAMVFLAGEVVVDYALRLNRELDESRLWINAYANDVPCYIPSKRILKEGGYEAIESLWYYDRPAQLAPETEDQIIGSVKAMLPKSFQTDPSKSDFPPPKNPNGARNSFKVRDGFEIELVVSEPLVVDPVAIDWDLSGRLWVVEMRDYPMGMDGKWKPGGRIKILTDTDGDGKYDKATVFLDEIPFPTGVTAWRKGALICTAPDILYAEDTNGDGKADVVKKLFSGFFTENYQARVNSLSLGLDNWIYGANGLLGGVIHGSVQGNEINIRGRDFRMKPDTGEFEPVAGLTQQGRARDDFGNWFGCDNSTLLRHYPLPDHYVRRNPVVATPNPAVFVPADPDPGRVYPASRTLARFNDPGAANHVTSGCGLGVYRDNLLGDEFRENVFVCEPVHNLVRRVVLSENGVTFSGKRAPGEETSEFLASTDNWSRPVQVRTGPDGALWVVDMYRYLIEHPRWIPLDRLSQIDVRAGDDMGRIYRVFPRGKKPRKIENLASQSAAGLAGAMNSPNGTIRDLCQMALTESNDPAAVNQLSELLRSSFDPAVRVQALCTLDGMQRLSPQLLDLATKDRDARVRREAVRIWEHFSDNSPFIQTLPDRLVNDTAKIVQYQLALSIGSRPEIQSSLVFQSLLTKSANDPWMVAALMSSVNGARAGSAAFSAALWLPDSLDAKGEIVGKLISTAVASKDMNPIAGVFATFLTPGESTWPISKLSVLGSILQALHQNGADIKAMVAKANAGALLARLFSNARIQAKEAPNPIVHISLLGYEPASYSEDIPVLAELLLRDNGETVRSACFAALDRIAIPEVPAKLIQSWNKYSLGLRAHVISFLLNRNEWAGALVDAIKSRTILPSEISMSDRKRLLTHSSIEIANRAKEIFGTEPSANRAEALQKLRPALTTNGDPKHGGEVFGRTCATCHRFRGQGAEVGPDLAALRGKDADYFLKNIFDPNAVVEPRFVAYNVSTRDGRDLSGIISSETSSGFVLAQANGAKENVLRKDVVEVRASGLSLMPEGLEQGLAIQDVADLISYIKSSPAAFGSASSSAAVAAKKKFMTDSVPSSLISILSSEQSSYPSWLGPLQMHHCRQTDGQSRVTWKATGKSTSPDELRFVFPAAMGFVSQPSGRFRLSINRRFAIEFDVTLDDANWSSADSRIRMSYSVQEANTEDSNGILELTIAKAILTNPDDPVTFELVGSLAKSQRWFGIYRLE